MNLSLTASTEWKTISGACLPCSVCEDIVYGKGYQLTVVFPAIEGEENRAKVKDCFLCESCYGALKDTK